MTRTLHAARAWRPAVARPGRTLDGDLRVAARVAPRTEAVVAGARRLTYAELDSAADGVAHGLRELGVRRGARVAVLLPNGVDLVVALFGIVRAGAAFVLVHPASREERTARMLADCGAVAVVADSSTAPRVRAAWARAGGGGPLILAGAFGRRGAVSLDALAANARPGPSRARPGDLAAIIYTSGSTGAPKGATFLHRAIHFAGSSIAAYLGLTGSDRILCALPLSHVYGLSQLVIAVRSGATLVLENGVAFPGRLVAALENERITALPGVPTLWQVLLGLEGLADRDLGHLRLLTNAGAALSVARADAVRGLFPGARLVSMYGQTECFRVSWLAPEEIEARPGSVGVPIPGTDVWIEDEAGARVPPGGVGELVVRGAHVMQGYWNDPAATARKLRPGRRPQERVLRTGDLFRSDPDGFLYFVSRSDDMIKSRGEKVAPVAVEEVLLTFDGVCEAAVVGVEDDLLGEAIVAHVSALPGRPIDDRALRRHCARALEDYMVPARVVVHDELPKNVNGKLDKLALAGRR